MQRGDRKRGKAEMSEAGGEERRGYERGEEKRVFLRGDLFNRSDPTSHRCFCHQLMSVAVFFLDWLEQPMLSRLPKLLTSEIHKSPKAIVSILGSH